MTTTPNFTFNTNHPQWEHQKARFDNRHPDTTAEANFDGQQTGKTKSAIDWMGYLSFQNKIKSCVVFVHKPNDITRFKYEIRKHISPSCNEYIIITDDEKRSPDLDKQLIEYYKSTKVYNGLIIVISTYTTASKPNSIVSRGIDILAERGPMLAIADDAHKAKNPRSQTGRFLMSIVQKFDFRMAMTATPIVKEAGSIFIINEFLKPNAWLNNMESFGVEKPSDFHIQRYPYILSRTFIEFFNKGTKTEGDRFVNYVNMRKLRKFIPELKNAFDFKDKPINDYENFMPSNMQSMLIDKIYEAKEIVMPELKLGYNEDSCVPNPYEEQPEQIEGEPKTSRVFDVHSTKRLHELGDPAEKDRDNAIRMKEINSYNMEIAVLKITRNLVPSLKLLDTLGLNADEFDVDPNEFNPRLDLLVSLIDGLGEREKAVVFCSSDEECSIIQNRLGKRSWIYGKKREHFGDKNIMLITLGKANTSIETEGCRRGFFYVRNYKHVEDKTCRRMLGISTPDDQRHFTTLVYEGVDTKILRSQSKKQNVAKQAFGTAGSQ